MGEKVLDIELERDIEAINTLIQNIIKKDNISFKNLIEILRKRIKEETTLKIPSSIFRERSLGILEALTQYLKEENNLSYHEIASLLNRDDRVIWRTYNNTKKKFKGKLTIDKKSFLIPPDIFANRKLGVLEVLTKYLKESVKLSNREIAGILNRDNRTIWTSYDRAKKKENEIK